MICCWPPIPSLTGYTSTYANVGKTSGWGIDLQVNAVPVETKDFTWNSTAITWSMDKTRLMNCPTAELKT